MTPWLTIIGVGENGLGELGSGARAIVETADIIVGSKRILAHENFGTVETHCWTSPFADMLARIEKWKGRNIVILATGDPMHFGVGATLARSIPIEDMTIIPAPSAFSLAAARLGWSLQDVEMISLHGRPVSLLHAAIQPGAKILALTASGQTPHEVAAILCARGFGASELTILEHMGGAKECRTSLTAADCNAHSFADFNTIGISCIAGKTAQILPQSPGLPDDAFVHDGQLTKREVRAITLAALGPTPDALLWDIGAGCGSIAIEWMRAVKGARAIAFEKNTARIKLIADNAVALGTPGLDVVAGDATKTLGNRDVPDAIFLGGAVTDQFLFDTCWGALAPGGRLVANAVTLEGEAALSARHETHGGELVRIDISRIAAIGARRVMRPRLAVTQWRLTKDWT